MRACPKAVSLPAHRRRQKENQEDLLQRVNQVCVCWGGEGPFCYCPSVLVSLGCAAGCAEDAGFQLRRLRTPVCTARGPITDL